MNKAIKELREVLAVHTAVQKADKQQQKTRSSKDELEFASCMAKFSRLSRNWIRDHGAEVLKQLSAGEAVSGFVARLQGAVESTDESEFGDVNKDLRIITIRMDDAKNILTLLKSNGVAVYQVRTLDEATWCDVAESLYNDWEEKDRRRVVYTRPAAGVSDEMKRALREMQRYLPLLERLENRPLAWIDLTHGLGIATLNGYKAALTAALSRDEGNG